MLNLLTFCLNIDCKLGSTLDSQLQHLYHCSFTRFLFGLPFTLAWITLTNKQLSMRQGSKHETLLGGLINRVLLSSAQIQYWKSVMSVRSSIEIAKLPSKGYHFFLITRFISHCKDKHLTSKDFYNISHVLLMLGLTSWK